MSEKGLRERFRAGEISRWDAVSEATGWGDEPSTMKFIDWLHRRGTVKLKQQPEPKKEKQLNDEGTVLRFKKGRRNKRNRRMK